MSSEKGSIYAHTTENMLIIDSSKVEITHDLSVNGDISGLEATFTNINATGTTTLASVDINGGTISGITELAIVDGGTGASNASDARTNLGLAIGSDVQAYDAELAALAGLTSEADKGIQFTGDGTAATFDLTAAGKALLDDADAADQRTTLGLVIGTDVQAYDAELAALASLTSEANKGIQFTGSGTAATFDLTAAGKALLDDADAADQRTTLGLVIGTDVQAYDAELAALASLTSEANKGIQFTGSGTAATFDLTAAGKALLADANSAEQRTTLGLVIGTDVQAYDAELAALASLTSGANKGIQFTGSGTAATFDLTAAGKALLADANNSEQRTTLGLGTIATQAATNVNIEGGNIDGTTIGNSLAKTGKFTTLHANSSITSNGNITAYYSSDINLKENIKNIKNPINKILSINGVTFDWKDKYIEKQGGEDGMFVRKNDVGVIAQEIEKVIPEIVVKRSDGYLGVKYEFIIPLLIEGIKEQQNIIETQNTKINNLEKIINKQQESIDYLYNKVKNL